MAWGHQNQHPHPRPPYEVGLAGIIVIGLITKAAEKFFDWALGTGTTKEEQQPVYVYVDNRTFVLNNPPPSYTTGTDQYQSNRYPQQGHSKNRSSGHRLSRYVDNCNAEPFYPSPGFMPGTAPPPVQSYPPVCYLYPPQGCPPQDYP